MQVICPHCGFTGTLKDSMIPDAGRTVDCLQCKKPFFVKKGQGGVGIAPDALAGVHPAPKAAPAPPVDRKKDTGAAATPPAGGTAPADKHDDAGTAAPPPRDEPPATKEGPAPPTAGDTAPAKDGGPGKPAPSPARGASPVQKEEPVTATPPPAPDRLPDEKTAPAPPPPPEAAGAPAESREDARKGSAPAEDAAPRRDAAAPPRPILVPKKASPGLDIATLIIPVITAVVFLVIGFYGGYTYHRNRVPVREILIPVGEETVATPPAPGLRMTPPTPGLVMTPAAPLPGEPPQGGPQ